MQAETQDTNQPISVTKEAVNGLPLRRFEGTIRLANRADDIAIAIQRIRAEEYVGFDTETKPSFSKGENHLTALLQIACSDVVFLFQLQYIEDLSPLFALLEDSGIVKAGVAIRDDIRKLQDRMAFEPGGFVEISELSQRDGIVNTGLRSLAAHYLGFRVSKGAQLSDWSRKRLTQSQLAYAATDAWVSRLLFEQLRSTDASFWRTSTENGRPKAPRKTNRKLNLSK